MLAQNFKTPTDLGISDKEFDALAKVLGMLERDELHHVPVAWTIQSPMETKGFNMFDWNCGTAACIGGWAEIIGKIKDFPHGENGDPLHELLFPDSYDIKNLRNITTSQAAIALRNYLTHGEPRWHEALAE